MSITYNEWKALVRESLERIADEAYQRATWFPGGQQTSLPPQISSPEEQICQLLGDYGFEDFIQSQETLITPSNKNFALRFVRDLRSFAAQLGTAPDPVQIIDNPSWAQIRQEAAKVREFLFGTNGQ